MSFTNGSFGEAFYRGTNRPSGTEDLYLGVGIHNDPNDPTQFINIRLTDGSSFYTAGGALISGSASLTFTQGAPNVPSQGWPVKITDGTNVLGTGSSGPLWVTGSVYVINEPQGTANVRVISGSITAIQVAGAEVTALNPVPVTWTGSPVVTLNQVVQVTGTVVLGRAVDVATMPAVTGTVVLGRAVDIATLPSVTVGNTVTVTGSVHMADVSTVTGTVVMGRAVDVATMPLVNVTGNVGISQGVAISNLPAVQTVTGTVAMARAVDVATLPAVTQGTPGSIGSPWFVQLVSGSDVVGQKTDPLWVTGTVHVDNPSGGGAGGNVTVVSGSITALQVGGVEMSSTNPLWVTGTVHVENPGGGAGGNVTALSGSVTGLLVGGVAVSNANPVPVTGTVAIGRAVDVATMPVVTVTGTVHMADVSTVTGSVTVGNAPNVTTLSGSVAGLLLGGVPVARSNALPVTGTVSMASFAPSLVDAGNSTTAILGAGQSFTGSAVDISNFGVTVVSVLADASGTLTLQNSQDNSHWDFSFIYQIPSGSPEHIQIGPQAQYFRLLYGNGTIGQQTVFRVQTIHRPVTSYSPVVPLQAPPDTNGDAILVKASITGKNSGGGNTYVDMKVSPAGAVQIGGTLDAIVADTVVSGSVIGLLVGGVPLAGSNPLPVTGTVVIGRAMDIATMPVVTVTGTVHMADVSTITGSITLASVGTITGSVSLARAVDIASLPAVAQGTPAGLGSPWRVQLVSGSDVVGQATNPIWITGSVFTLNPGGAGTNVTTLSGSVVGMLYGGVAAGQSNPFWVTGTVHVENPSGGASGNVTALSGSVTGLLVGGVALSNANPLPVTGTVHLADVSTITGSVTLASVGTITGSVTLAAAPNVFVASGSVTGLLVGGVPLSQANPVPINQLSGSVTGLLVGGVALANNNPLPISGTVVMPAMPQALVDATNSSTTLLTASANFIGTGIDVSRYGLNAVNVLADQAGTLFMQYSSDNSHWDISSSYAILSGVAMVISMGPEAQFYRTFYANGGVAQSAVFRLQTIHKPITGFPDSTPIGNVIDPGTDVLITKGVLSGKVIGGTGYVDVGTVGTALSVMPASGSVTGLLVGGQAVQLANPVPVTGTVHLADLSAVKDVSGSIVAVSVAAQEVTFANPFPVKDVSGSIVAVMAAGTEVTRANPLPVTKYDIFGVAEQSGTFLSTGYTFKNVATSGTTALVTAAIANKKITVTSAVISANAALGLIYFISSASNGSTIISSYLGLQASAFPGQNIILPYNPNGWFQTTSSPTAAGTILQVGSSTTGSVGISITYFVNS